MEVVVAVDRRHDHPLLPGRGELGVRHSSSNTTVPVNERMDLGDEEHREHSASESRRKVRVAIPPPLQGALDQGRIDELGPACSVRLRLEGSRLYLGSTHHDPLVHDAQNPLELRGIVRHPRTELAIHDEVERPGDVVTVGGPLLGDQAVEDDRPRLFDRELGALDEVREVRLVERERLSGAVGRGGPVDDPWLTVNLRALRATMDLVPDGEVAAWIRVDRQLAVSGTAELLAYRYAAILSPRSSTVVLTVTDMGRMMRRVDVLAGYLRLVRAFADAGLSVIVDGVGEFSPVPIAMGAAGSIAGTRAYRTAPLRARHDGTPRNQAKLKYVVPERFQRLDLSDARRRTASGNLPKCPHDHCRALLCDGDNSDLRHHNAHLLADAATKAQTLGPLGLARWLSSHTLAEPTSWAQALVEASDLGELKAEA